jgi:hypothetical protein
MLTMLELQASDWDGLVIGHSGANPTECGNPRGKGVDQALRESARLELERSSRLLSITPTRGLRVLSGLTTAPRNGRWFFVRRRRVRSSRVVSCGSRFGALPQRRRRTTRASMSATVGRDSLSRAIARTCRSQRGARGSSPIPALSAALPGLAHSP